jgi:nicotinamidase-related amidase
VPLIDASAAALVLVDYQQRLMPAIHRGDVVVAQALRLAAIGQALGLPLIGTEQNPHRLGPNVERLRQRCGSTLAKTHFDACADGLVDALRALPARPVREVVVAGCEAHVCLLQTALGLLDAGLRVWLVAEACGSRRPADHALAMARLQQAGATLVSPEMVAFEGLRHCRDARFKAVLDLVKPLVDAPPPAPPA